MSARGGVYVVGDVGGHRDALEGLLEDIGVVIAERHIPEGVTVVQVGDLVHRGPDSDGVVQLVSDLMHENPDRWVQLMGNHEAQYCVEEVFLWREKISGRAQKVLRTWWEEGAMRLAHACNGVLVTHAGLTLGCWKHLGEPRDAQHAASLINDASRNGPVWNTGVMIDGVVRRDAGVLWAEAGSEVLIPWLERGELPFSLVHGHSSAFEWGARRWRDETVERAAAGRVRLEKNRIMRVQVGERAIWGVDPGHGRNTAPFWGALRLAETAEQ